MQILLNPASVFGFVFGSSPYCLADFHWWNFNINSTRAPGGKLPGLQSGFGCKTEENLLRALCICQGSFHFQDDVAPDSESACFGISHTPRGANFNLAAMWAPISFRRARIRPSWASCSAENGQFRY
jgi:hypothetical protein